ncbi:MAG: hypothetical protein R3C05_15340 [Pirellulaceae bacterium]
MSGNRMSAVFGGPCGSLGKSLLIIDGIEQLDPLRRWMLRRFCKQSGQTLLATMHQKLAGFHVIHQTATDIDLAGRIVRRLLADTPWMIDSAEAHLRQIWNQHDGNFRNLWSSMYDWYQLQTVHLPS